MPREIITVQVGQCGNQIGTRFWEMALREQAVNNPKGLFFKNVDTRSDPPRLLRVADGRCNIQALKARAVIVDMEEGVVNEMLKGPLGEIFDTRQLLTDVSGSGNNWAHGHNLYGPQYRERLVESIRRPAEECDSLQSFLLLQSLGGGTGSGLGCYILELLKDEFPEAYRFAASVFPSEDDDVVTSPYNALLSLAQLTRHADAVLPLENQALMDICSLLDSRTRASPSRPTSFLSGPDADSRTAGKRRAAFDGMNGVAANLLLNMTSSMRFEGSLNVDLNEITMNLVPYPRIHFLQSAMSPLAAPLDLAKLAGAPRAVDQVFSEVFSREHQLIKADPRHSTYLACGLLMRGNIAISDVNRNVARLKPSLRMAHWNCEGFKLGICSTPPVGVPFSLLCLANNCCIRTTFGAMRERFLKLYKRRVYLHHYTQYMELEDIRGSLETVSSLIQEYEMLDTQLAGPAPVRRFKPVGCSFL
ncbi:hypothetical protein WJX72_003106 [[Myrmecia] bisecta]|uniref:Tubulin epsilon chain n=1 Tax=[Myrmecia] bisecta TaxID=41462 RepID=A0AAW1Q449_9CHLO